MSYVDKNANYYLPSSIILEENKDKSYKAYFTSHQWFINPYATISNIQSYIKSLFSLLRSGNLNFLKFIVHLPEVGYTPTASQDLVGTLGTL